MENNFNNDLNKRVLDKLEEKIAIETFKKKEKIEKNTGTVLKVASVAIVTMLLAGNIFTYATYEQNIFSFILNKIGILENYTEKSIDVNDEKLSDIKGKNILTLVNYGMDKDTLIVNYSLQLEEKPEYFMEDLVGDFYIVNGENKYRLNDFTSTYFYKINDTEYDIIQMFNIDFSKVLDDARFISDIKLYKEFEGPIEDLLGEWHFDIKLEKSKLDLKYQEYYLENKIVEFFDEKGEKEIFKSFEEDSNLELNSVKIEIVELKQSDLATKLIFDNVRLYTDVEYFIEIIDENGKKIVDNIDFKGNELVFKRVDLNSRITINIYGHNYQEDGKLEISKGSIVLDLSNDLNKK